MSLPNNHARFPFWGEILYYTLLGIIFALAIQMRMALPSIPFLDNDSWNYMQAAITRLFSGTEVPTYRGFLYPFLLRWTFWLHADFRAIACMQHVAGLLAGGILLVAWHRMRVFLPEGMLVEGMHRLAGVAMIAITLLTRIGFLMEHSIRPEAIFPLNIALCLWLATEFSRAVFLRAVFGAREGILGGLLIFFAIMAYYLKPAWGLGFLCAMLPLFLALVRVQGHWIEKGCMFGLSLAAVFVFLSLPEAKSHAQVEGNGEFLSETLFSAHAEIIYDVLQRRVHNWGPQDPHARAAQTMLSELDHAIAHPTRMFYGYSRINPDDVLYHGPMKHLSEFMKGDISELKSFCYYYYMQAWKEYPLRMLEKIGTQFWYFYSPARCTVFDRSSELKVQPYMVRSRQVLLDRPAYPWPPLERYRHTVFGLQETQQVISIPRWVLVLGSILNALYFPLALSVLFATGALALGWMGETGKLLFPGGLWGLYLLSYNFGNSLTIAIVHVMGVSRYHFGQTLFSAVSESFAAVFLCALLVQGARIGRLAKNN